MWDTKVSRSPAEESKEKAQSDLPTREGAIGGDRFAIRIPCKKVMLTYDDSLISEKAFQVARAMARKLNAKLLILGVAPLPPNPSISDLQKRIDDARQRFSKRFYKIRLDGMNEGLQIETTLALGDASELTRRNAERFHAHLIVAGYPNHTAALGITGTAKEVSVVRFHASAGAVSSSDEIGFCEPSETNREIE